MLKNSTFFALFLVGCLYAHSQTVQSSCNTSDSIIQLYKKDAQELAERRIYNDASTYMDSVYIPAQWIDTSLSGLSAVYNATLLPARDSVINLFNIHTFPNLTYGSITIAANKSLNWMQQLANGNIPTGNLQVDSFLLVYHLKFSQYRKLMSADY